VQDIVAKIIAACRGGPNSEMCILSSHGSVSMVALHKPGNIVNYEVVVLFTSFYIGIHSIIVYLIVKKCFDCTIFNWKISEI
jgi:hypothetical protein